MRNRPDSRHRLAVLRPAEPPGSASGWVPRADEWSDEDWENTRSGPDRRAGTTSPRGVFDDDVSDDLVSAAEVCAAEATADLHNEGEPAAVDSPATAAATATVPASATATAAASLRRHAAHRPWGRLAQRWVPESLRDSRVDPGRRGALLLTVVAAVAALVAAVGVWRDRPEPRPVQSVSLAQVTDPATARPGALPLSKAPGLTPARLPATAERSAAAGTAMTGSGVVVVSVTGAVHRPGLVRLPPGARVADAIDKAGGITESANITGLNLAERLSDGDSVVVSGVEGSQSAVSGSGSRSGPETGPARTTASGAAAGKIDLNSVDTAALDALPGVGPVTAAGIIAWRDKNGRFTSVEQLQEIQGIGPAKFAALAKLVTV